MSDESTVTQLMEKLGNDRKHDNLSKKTFSSDSSSPTMITGSGFKITAHTGKGVTSHSSEDSSFSSEPSLGTPHQSALRVERNTGVSSSARTAATNTADESNTEAHHMPTEGTSDGALGDMESDFRLHLERREMLIPSKAKAVLMDQISTAESKKAAEKSQPTMVSSRIRAYAEKASSIPSEESFVTIGDASIPREKIAAVDDVDGNKIQDYIVTNVGAKNYSGTVRLYLMGEDDKFLYTRDLVPGNWGFNHGDLNPGDRYGTTVFRLPNAGSSSQCFIAITAPGDRSMQDDNGVVYILELSRKGNVKNHRKLSATDFLKLVEEQRNEETKMSAGSEQRLQHLHGVTSMVFFNASGGVQAVINVKSPKDNALLRNIDKHLQRENANRNKGNVGRKIALSRMDSNQSCLFNETHCDCKLDSKGEAAGNCYEMFESKEEHGRFVCLKKSCPSTYKCSCDGDTRCRRIEEREELYVAYDKGQNGEIYCTTLQRTVLKTVPVTVS